MDKLYGRVRVNRLYFLGNQVAQSGLQNKWFTKQFK